MHLPWCGRMPLRGTLSSRTRPHSSLRTRRACNGRKPPTAMSRAQPPGGRASFRAGEDRECDGARTEVTPEACETVRQASGKRAGTALSPSVNARPSCCRSLVVHGVEPRGAYCDRITRFRFGRARRRGWRSATTAAAAAAASDDLAGERTSNHRGGETRL